jgi:hypothetical protein
MTAGEVRLGYSQSQVFSLKAEHPTIPLQTGLLGGISLRNASMSRKIAPDGT